MFPVRDAEFHVAVLTEVPLQPCGLTSDLVQNTEHELFGGHWSREYADILLVGNAGVSPCLDEGITQSSVP